MSFGCSRTVIELQNRPVSVESESKLFCMRRFGGHLLISMLVVPTFLLADEKEPEPAQTPSSLVARGQDQLRMSQNSAALMTCDRAIRLNINYAPAYLCQAQAYEALGQSDAALQTIVQALQLDPALVEARKL